MNKNLHLLPTDKPSKLLKSKKGLFLQKYIYENKVSVSFGLKNQNIYITNDEEIKKGDWVYYKTENRILVNNVFYYKLEDRFKIILTTDQDLIKDGVQAIPDEFLEWFVKNPNYEEVKIEKTFKVAILNSYEYVVDYKIIIPKEEPKQEICEYLKEVGCIKDICSCNTGLKQETLEEFAKRRVNEEKLNTYTPYNIEDAIKEGAKWQMNKQDEFTLGFLHWYNTSQECETYLRRNYPKNITMNGEHYKKVLQINKELLEMYKNTLPR